MKQRSSLSLTIYYQVANNYYKLHYYTKLLNSLINTGSPTVKNGGFFQHCFYNAIFTKQTVDGLNTFPAMKRIQYDTP